ncbi:MAG: hypothetical protein SFX74_05730 [Fimbriimonadaceae bacterium]|nr:hypothetical protein [Fimbriimonadaceae bacterium]
MVIEIDSSLLTQLESEAQRRGVSVHDAVQAALASWIGAPFQTEPRPRVLASFGSGNSRTVKVAITDDFLRMLREADDEHAGNGPRE